VTPDSARRRPLLGGQQGAQIEQQVGDLAGRHQVALHHARQRFIDDRHGFGHDGIVIDAGHDLVLECLGAGDLLISHKGYGISLLAFARVPTMGNMTESLGMAA